MKQFRPRRKVIWKKPHKNLTPIEEKEESDELAKIQSIEVEFMRFVLPWLRLVPQGSSPNNKVFA